MKKRVIITIIVILSLVAIGIIAINVTNNIAEEQIASLLDEWGDENQEEYNFSYDSVAVDATKGLLTVNGMKLLDSETKLDIEAFAIDIPLSQAISLAQNPYNTELTDVKVAIKGIKFSDNDDIFNIEQSEMKVHFTGNINTKISDSGYEIKDSDFIINSLGMENNDVVFNSTMGTMSFDDLSFEAKGNFNLYNFDNESENLMVFMDIVDDASLNFEGFKYDAEQQIRESISMIAYMFLGDVSFIGNPENWAIDKLSLLLDVDENKLSINDLSLETNWIDFNIQANTTIDELTESYTPLFFKLSINDYIDDLRPIFEMISSEISDEELPEGKFSLSLFMENENSYPDVKIEELK
ncbi:MAG: hypothetical protein PQJ49_02645 [Sphaerochaetaceae bacterium]|nr:hypothetical protein [Sphaerochaetaceae bacterium]MDC7248799.1 hypothetical protein [Sphaerochaetaceae bacterium]